MNREERTKDYIRRWGNAQRCDYCGFVMSYGRGDTLQTCCGKTMTPVKDTGA